MTDQSITVNTALLKQKLKLVTPYAPAKSPLPITSHILLTIDAGFLELRATDLEQYVRTRLPATVHSLDGTFSACLPAKELKKLIESLRDSEVLIEVNDKHHATITAGSHTSKLRGMKPDDLPAAPYVELEDQAICFLDAAQLKRLADRTAGAAAKDDTRPVLRGVLFEQNGDTLTATATDGARLATAEEQVRAEHAGPAPARDVKLTIPAKALKQAAASLAPSTHGIHLYHSPNRKMVMLSSEDTVVTIRLIEGTYPNWRQIMPHAFKTHVTVVPDELLHAIKVATARARLVAPKGGHGKPEDPRVRLESSELNDLRVSSRDVDGNEFAAHMDADFNGPMFDISFNPHLLVEAIKALVGSSTASSTRITATTTVTPSRTATAAPIPSPVVSTDPVVLASLVASAQIRLSAVETRYGPGTPQYDAANQRLVAARAARKARHGVPTLPSEPPVVELRKPDPATASVPATGSTIELCFTGPNSACLIRAGDGSGDQTHVIPGWPARASMPMHVESKREPVPGRSGDPVVERDEAEQAA